MNHSARVAYVNEQIDKLMVHTKSRVEATNAFFKYDENTELAANAIHFDHVISSHFSDHFRTIMATHKNIAIRIYHVAQVFRILKDSDDLYEFVCLVSEII